MAWFRANNFVGKGDASRGRGRSHVGALLHRSDPSTDPAAATRIWLRSSFHSYLRSRTDKPRVPPGPQGGMRTTNTSVMEMLAFAWNVRDYQFVDAPKWVASSRYDVVLTPAENEVALGSDPAPAATLGSQGRNQQRLQAVMRDRFGLVLRAETRDLPIYALVQARDGSKLSVHPATAPQAVSMQQTGHGHLVTSDISLPVLANFLSFEMARPVVDETGLRGLYDFKLDWNPDLDMPEVQGNPSPDESIFTALTSQLGLRLESKRGPVQVYVVEKIERPTEN